MTEAIEPLPRPARLAWLSAPPAPIRYGVKWAATVSASLWLAHGFDLPHGIWITITVIFVMQPVSGASASKGLLRLLGTVLAALVSIAIYGAFAQLPPLLLASIFVCVTAGVYVMTGPYYQYAGNVFAFTTLIILGSALASPKDAVETIAFERASMVALGILLVLVADSIFWPVRVGARIRGMLGEGIARANETLCRCLDDLVGAVTTAPAPERDPTRLASQLQLTSQYRMEAGVSRAEADGAARLSALVEALEVRAGDLADLVAARPPRRLTQPAAEAIGALSAAIDQSLRAIGAAIRSGDRSGASISGVSGVSSVSEALARVDALRVDVLDAFLSPGSEARSLPDREALVRSARAMPLLRDVADLLERIEVELALFFRIGGGRDARPRGGIAWSSLRVDPFRLQMAMRAALASCFAMLLMLSLGWSVNTVAMIIAFIAAAAPTRTAGTKLGIGVMAAGLAAWALADLGIVFVHTHVSRMPLALAGVFALIFALGWLVVARPKVAPLASLVGLMTILPIFSGSSPPQSVEAPYDTAVYILVGVTSGLVAQHLLWPRTAKQLFWQRAAALLGTCRTLIASDDPLDTARREHVPQALTAYATQLAMQGQLDGQARAEATNEPADDELRAGVLVRTQALFNACVRDTSVAAWPAPGDELPDSVASLVDAMRRRDEAILGSLDWVVATLRGDEGGAPPELADAEAEVDRQLDALHPETSTLSVPLADSATARIGARRDLSREQTALQDWLMGWHDSDGGSA